MPTVISVEADPKYVEVGGIAKIIAQLTDVPSWPTWIRFDLKAHKKQWITGWNEGDWERHYDTTGKGIITATYQLPGDWIPVETWRAGGVYYIEARLRWKESEDASGETIWQQTKFYYWVDSEEAAKDAFEMVSVVPVNQVVKPGEFAQVEATWKNNLSVPYSCHLRLDLRHPGLLRTWNEGTYTATSCAAVGQTTVTLSRQVPHDWGAHIIEARVRHKEMSRTIWGPYDTFTIRPEDEPPVPPPPVPPPVTPPDEEEGRDWMEWLEEYWYVAVIAIVALLIIGYALIKYWPKK